VRRFVRATTAGVFAFVAIILMMVTSTMTSIVAATAVAATTALIMGGTGNPLSTEKDTLPFVQKYLGMAVDNYIAPSGIATPPMGESYNPVAVITPEEWAPEHGTLSLDQSIAIGKTNLDNCIRATDCQYNTDVGSAAPAVGDDFVVFGYSQSATIGTLEKRALAAQYPDGGGPDVSFVFIGNGNRPNGGFLARGPEGFTMPLGLIFGGATFSGPSPTNTQYQTVDIAEQYDAWADVPLNPLNLLAVVNWYSSYVHYNYADVSLNDPGIIDQGQYGDTHYYMIPQKILPLLSTVQALPVIGNPLADALDAPLRVLVEAAYNRSISPGQSAQFNPLYMPNPVKLAADFLAAIPTGLDNAFEDTMGIRPFGTVRPGPYGVGGPAVTETDPPATTAVAQSTTTTEKTTETADASKTDASKTTAFESKTGKEASSVADSSALEADPAAGDDAEKPGESAPEGDSTSKDSTPAVEPEQPTTEPKPVETTGTKDVTTKKPDTVATDAPATDGATTQSPTGAKQSDDVKHQPRHALSGSADSSPSPITKRISEMAKEAQASATSASAGDDSSPQQSGPRHAR
jgi:PE-PPE domain